MKLAQIGSFLVKDDDISKIKLELIRFFKENPGTIDMASCIAVRLGRTPFETEQALEELVSKNICRKLGSAPSSGAAGSTGSTGSSQSGNDHNGNGHAKSESLFAYAPSIMLFERIGEAVPTMNPGTRMDLVTMLLNRAPR